jgi:DNA-binding PadR family transcriptional regulator
LKSYQIIGLLKKEAGFNELGCPVTYYSLTELGIKVLERLEDAEKILKESVGDCFKSDSNDKDFFEEYMR